MKLAVAAAVLAETFPLVLTSSLSSTSSLGGLGRVLKKNDNRHLAAVGAAGAGAAPRADLVGPVVRRLKDAAGEGIQRTKAATTLRNLAAGAGAGQQQQQECDPSAPADADVGVLSCGEGRYCLDISDTTRGSGTNTGGGVCVDDASGNVAVMHRTLQTDVNGTDPTILDLVSVICDGVTYPNFICQCSAIDPVAYTASASCAVAENCVDIANICGDNFTLCYSSSLDIEIASSYEYSFKTCDSLTLPEAFSYCATDSYTANATTCEMTIDDVVCNVCTPGSDGRGFDCLNTALNFSGYAPSNYTVPDAVTILQAGYGYYSPIYDGPCASGCNLCGEGGAMTIRDVNVSFPTGDSFECGYLEIAAFAGAFANSSAELGTDLCVLLPPLVMDTCGCEGGVMAPTTAPVPTEAPGADGGVPTDPPTVMSGPPAMVPTMGGTTPAPAGGGAAPMPSGAVSKPAGGFLVAAAVVALGTMFWAV